MPTFTIKKWIKCKYIHQSHEIFRFFFSPPQNANARTPGSPCRTAWRLPGPRPRQIVLIISLSPLGVEPKIGGKTPKWMVKIMENPIKIDDLEENPLFSETSLSLRWLYQNKKGEMLRIMLLSWCGYEPKSWLWVKFGVTTSLTEATKNDQKYENHIPNQLRLRLCSFKREIFELQLPQSRHRSEVALRKEITQRSKT